METLEELGFVACPFGGCVFSPVARGKNGAPRVRGVLGIHVDDGLGGGDEFFQTTIQRLKEEYSFGAYYEKEFDFCGIHFK